MKFSSVDYLARLNQALHGFPHAELARVVDVFQAALREKRKILVMGNGGSAAIASHWVCDMNKGCGYGRADRFRMICLNDNVPTMLAYANDVRYAAIFVEQLKNYLDPGDVVIAISASGKSANVVEAIRYARDHQATTIGVIGFDGGELKGLVDIPIHIQSQDMQIVEDVHSMVMHMCMQAVQENMGGAELSAERAAAAKA